MAHLRYRRRDRGISLRGRIRRTRAANREADTPRRAASVQPGSRGGRAAEHRQDRCRGAADAARGPGDRGVDSYLRTGVKPAACQPRDPPLSSRPLPRNNAEVLVGDKVEYLNPPGACPAQGLYSHAARVRGGTTYYVAGQLAVGADGEVVGVADFDRQF